MAIIEIEMNTSLLNRDIRTLESTVNQLEAQMKKMFDHVNELDKMWDGPANAAFQEQFQQDYQSCKAMCQVLRELIESMQHARQEYDQCEQSIESLIQSIKI